MATPATSPIFEGEIATYWFDDNILIALSKSIKRTVENITGNVTLVKQITDNKRVPLLIFLKKSPIPDKETREFSKRQLPTIYSAMAMVSKPGLSSFIMDIFFRFQKPPIPMRSFTDEVKAKKWLKQFVVHQ